MNTLIISYDLNNKSKQYESLYEAIKSAKGWWHYLESFWIIITEKDVTEWTNILKTKIEKDDSFIIIDIKGGATNGWLPKSAWDWIKKNTQIK